VLQRDVGTSVIRGTVDHVSGAGEKRGNELKSLALGISATRVPPGPPIAPYVPPDCGESMAWFGGCDRVCRMRRPRARGGCLALSRTSGRWFPTAAPGALRAPRWRGGTGQGAALRRRVPRLGGGTHVFGGSRLAHGPGPTRGSPTMPLAPLGRPRCCQENGVCTIKFGNNNFWETMCGYGEGGQWVDSGGTQKVPKF
jgi:hypothetical protein